MKIFTQYSVGLCSVCYSVFIFGLHSCFYSFDHFLFFWSSQSWTHDISKEKEFLRKLVKANVITDLTNGIWVYNPPLVSRFHPRDYSSGHWELKNVWERGRTELLLDLGVLHTARFFFYIKEYYLFKERRKNGLCGAMHTRAFWTKEGTRRGVDDGSCSCPSPTQSHLFSMFTACSLKCWRRWSHSDVFDFCHAYIPEVRHGLLSNTKEQKSEKWREDHRDCAGMGFVLAVPIVPRSGGRGQPPPLFF